MGELLQNCSSFYWISIDFCKPCTWFWEVPMPFIIKSGEPCVNPDCGSDLSQPCEVCGRIGMKGDLLVRGGRETVKEVWRDRRLRFASMEQLLMEKEPEVTKSEIKEPLKIFISIPRGNGVTTCPFCEGKLNFERCKPMFDNVQTIAGIKSKAVFKFEHAFCNSCGFMADEFCIEVGPVEAYFQR